MSRIVILESQYKRIFETGSNSAAMDLDIYVQPVDRDTDNGNENVIESIDDMCLKMKEIENMFEQGKKIPQEIKFEIFKLQDSFNKIYDVIKSKI